MQVINRNNLAMAIRVFRKKAQKEGIIIEARQRQGFEKRSDKKARKSEQSIIKTMTLRKFKK